MTHNYAERKPMFVEENPDLKVHALNCVPTYRPKGSWTNGIKAYEKGKGSEATRYVGWFFPPRIRNTGHHNRKGPAGRNHRRELTQRVFADITEEE